MQKILSCLWVVLSMHCTLIFSFSNVLNASDSTQGSASNRSVADDTPRGRALFGARFKTLNSEAEMVATGILSQSGVLMLKVPGKSLMAKYGFAVNDVVLEINQQKITHEQDFIKRMRALKTGTHQVKVWRARAEHTFNFTK